jgi:putative transposase
LSHQKQNRPRPRRRILPRLHRHPRGPLTQLVAVGSKGDSYDNAMAEAFNSLFKAELIRNPVTRPRGGWKSVTDVEIAAAEHVDWFNHRRLHGEIGLVPPAEFEANHRAAITTRHYPETPVLTEVGSK